MARPAIEITKEMCEKATELASQGMTLEQIANSLGMCYDTLNEKRKEFSEFSEAIKKGQAKGIVTATSHLMTLVEKDNLGAICFYLKNQAGWADKQEVEHSGAFNVSMPLKDANTL